MKDEGEKVLMPLKERTKRFALQIIQLYSGLPKTTQAQVLGKQMLRSGTSVGAHYRESIRSRSNAELISKLEVALQELEETMYWIELIQDSININEKDSKRLYSEANELIAILTTCVKKVKSNKKL